MEDHLNYTNVSAEANPCERSEYEEPQEGLEQAIARMWKDLFKVDRVGRNDNFFELGGNSFLGMELSEMMVTHLGIEVPVLTIFQHPTVAEIAQVSASQ